MYKLHRILASVTQKLPTGEMPTVPSFPAFAPPPFTPRTDRPSVAAIFCAVSMSVPSQVRFGRRMCTEARKPVPRLVGEEVTALQR